jgi:hypothetical protein
VDVELNFWKHQRDSVFDHFFSAFALKKTMPILRYPHYLVDFSMEQTKFKAHGS